MKRFLRGAGFYIILILVILLLTTFFSPGRSLSEKTKISYDDLIKEIAADNVKIVYINYQDLYGLYKDSAVLENSFPGEYDFSTRILSEDSFLNDVRIAKGDTSLSVQNFGFQVVIAEEETTPFIMLILPYLGIVVIFFVFWFILMRQQGGGGKVMNFGKSRHRVAEDNRKKVTFADVEGANEEKDELREIVDFLKDPRKFLELGARIPKGVLLVGPPGTGKTLLAKAVAGEANVQFFSISGSDFVEMFVGVGASRVRDLFDQAKKNLPCIVFIDEIDAVGRHRGAGLGGGHDEREQTLNQLLVEMDGFTQNEGIIVIAATNRPDILDPALLRPGRFDRQITVQYPDIGGREAILKLHAKNKPIGEDVDLKAIARRTPMFTGADLENILNEAAILAARKNKKQINMDEVIEAIARVEMGPEKRSRIVTERDRKLVAYHEAGHAIVAYYLPNCDPVNEVSIIPRGMAGGYTQTVANEDTSFISRAAILDRIAMSMGGHAAEKLIMHDVTTGSNSDLQNATGLVRRMVTEFGMSDAVGPVYLGGENEVFLGRNYTTQHTYSERVASEVDAEIRSILENSYNQAISLLDEHIDKLHGLAELLLKQEKIDGEDFRKFMAAESAPAEEPAPAE